MEGGNFLSKVAILRNANVKEILFARLGADRGNYICGQCKYRNKQPIAAGQRLLFSGWIV